MTNKYEEALHQAQAELESIEDRRAALLRLIANLKELSKDDRYELTPPPGYVPQGLTEEMRTILSLTMTHLDAMQIRDALIQRGFKHNSTKNLLINVHTVLGRIEKELDVIERDGKPAYKAKVQVSIYGPHNIMEIMAEAAKRVAATGPVYQKAIADAMKAWGMEQPPEPLPLTSDFSPGTTMDAKKKK